MHYIENKSSLHDKTLVGTPGGFAVRAVQLNNSLGTNDKVTHDLLNYLHNWWKDHILYQDKRYAAFFEEKRRLSKKDKRPSGKLPNN